ncbi:hypothetical protein RHMOL_Rhmol04G0061400 [Rhododendron molle]|uniref:Uncharacterized protein n=1 Tax=Rhododendron molle TaxID=49168 RepID=A0ACC0NZZ4_RHOML|nr:hypothetical protein RHMOL_Rhmol04G0061400 [Rhododendron molle]
MRTSKPSDRAFDDLNLISTINGSRSLVAEMRLEPSNARSDGLEMHSTNSKSVRVWERQIVIYNHLLVVIRLLLGCY